MKGEMTSQWVAAEGNLKVQRFSLTDIFNQAAYLFKNCEVGQ